MAAVREALASTEPASAKYRMIAADGRVRWVYEFIHRVGGTKGPAGPPPRDHGGGSRKRGTTTRGYSRAAGGSEASSNRSR